MRPLLLGLQTPILDPKHASVRFDQAGGCEADSMSTEQFIQISPDGFRDGHMGDDQPTRGTQESVPEYILPGAYFPTSPVPHVPARGVAVFKTLIDGTDICD